MTSALSDRRAGTRQRWHEKFLVEERVVPASSRRNLYIVSAVLMVVGLVLFLVVLDSVRESDGLSAIDRPIQAWLEGMRSPTLTVVMAVVATVFGPIVLPIVVLITVVWWGIAARHAWRPLLLAVSMGVGVATVQILAPVIGRHRPPVSSMLIGVDHTSSFPSGHVMGAADFLLITAYLVFSRRHNPVHTVIAVVLAFALALATAACRVYLGYHWPTDVLASMSLSLVVIGGVIAVDTWRTVRVRSSGQESS
ncbi:membrane-associated phospholipid phosphatase [Leifsonia sp. EB41]|uniref:phosphatase PAP2 family protein n=1 Tax=Leifsonia sp. EB41 TaxID=3156260 RepID=UPI00351481A1